MDAMQGRPHDAGRLLRVQNGGRGDRISGGHRPMTACALSRVAEMYNAGKTIDEIAEERGLAVSTICSHLSSYIATGLLDINNFVSADKREKAMKLMEQAEEIGSVYQTLAEILTTAETSFFLAWMRERKKN